VLFSEVVFLEVEDARAAQRAGLSVANGSSGERDPAGLAAAVGNPRQTWDGTPVYPSLATMAAVYMLSIAQNQPFVDGNKRAGIIAALLFLELNGYPRSLEPRDWGDVLERVANRQLHREGVVKMIAETMGGDVEIEAK
jgi:death-on-curing protein